MTKKKVEKKDTGRPTDYDAKNFPDQAHKLLAKHGYTMEELADFFSVVPSTLYKWQSEYPKFKEAIRAGRDRFDTDRVENALLQTALGVEYTETTVEQYIDKTGKPQTKKKAVKKYIGGNPVAQKFWLSNRDPSRWKEKREVNNQGSIEIVNYSPEAYKEAQSNIEGQFNDLD